MRVEIAIERKTKKLIEEAREEGIYENFGQKEVRELEDKYGDGGANFEALAKIRMFDDWCSSYCG